jgi:hypothetical protein
MKGSPVKPGGSLTSKPTWLNTSRVFSHVGFFFESNWSRLLGTMSENTDGRAQFRNGAAGRYGWL